jgi:hypothetical protein
MGNSGLCRSSVDLESSGDLSCADNSSAEYGQKIALLKPKHQLFSNQWRRKTALVDNALISIVFYSR